MFQDCLDKKLICITYNPQITPDPTKIDTTNLKFTNMKDKFQSKQHYIHKDNYLNDYPIE